MINLPPIIDKNLPTFGNEKLSLITQNDDCSESPCKMKCLPTSASTKMIGFYTQILMGPKKDLEWKTKLQDIVSKLIS